MSKDHICRSCNGYQYKTIYSNGYRVTDSEKQCTKGKSIPYGKYVTRCNLYLESEKSLMNRIEDKSW